jgi:hypothetical protein
MLGNGAKAGQCRNRLNLGVTRDIAQFCRVRREVPLYFFHVCNGDGFTEDEEGRELPDLEAARAYAIRDARSIMADELQHGVMNLASFIEIEEGGELRMTVPFSDAFEFTDNKPS